MEKIIPENDADLYTKCDTLSIGTQTAQKSTRERGKQYKNATIRYLLIRYAHKKCQILVLAWNQSKTTTLINPVLLEQNKNL